MKILNLYAGIGGNRKLWGDEHDVTAIECDQNIADVYKDFFPNDNVIVTDAHGYLLEHYKEYDFIWASPPCPTHSRINISAPKSGESKFNKNKPRYPEMQLYQEIIFLKHFAPDGCKWVIENVIPYYEYLIEPNIIMHRHPFWCNFYIEFEEFKTGETISNMKGSKETFGFDISKSKIKNKRKSIRNCVLPELGEYILNQAMNQKNENQLNLFEGD